MLKKVGVPILTTSLVVGVLAGCGANKEEFSKGIAFYNQGSFESLIKSQEFFIDYIETNGESKSAVKWLNKINKTISGQVESQTDLAYASQDFETALKYIEVGLTIEPSNESFQSAYSLIIESINEQTIFDEYADYLEENYVVLKKHISNWETIINSAKQGQMTLGTVKNAATNSYKAVGVLREKINNKTFELNSSETAHFKELNLSLFDYVLSVENELSNLLTYLEVEELPYLADYFDNFTVTGFTNYFSSLADDMLHYTTQTYQDGTPVRNIKNTLDFTKAYEEFLNGTTEG